MQRDHRIGAASSGFNLFVLGTPIIAVLNPCSGLTLVWYLGQPGWSAQCSPAVHLLSRARRFILGNVATLYMNLMRPREDDRPDLLVPGLTVPLYWLMMSAAAAKAAFQLVCTPFYWRGRRHGLNEDAGQTHAEQAA